MAIFGGDALSTSLATISAIFMLVSAIAHAETAASRGDRTEVPSAMPEGHGILSSPTADNSGGPPNAAVAVIVEASGSGGSNGPDSEQSSGGDGRELFMIPEHGFRLEYPRGFVARSQDISKLGRFSTGLLASFYVMNPTMAAGDLAGIEPPDLEIRVYSARAAQSLEDWLRSVEFVSVQQGAVGERYRIGGIDGLRICQSTMIAPGCSIFVLRQGSVYQMTAASLEGEAILDTFKFVSP
jgi:hypothetical protein